MQCKGVLSERFPDYRTSVIMSHQESKGRETPQVCDLSLTRLLAYSFMICIFMLIRAEF